MAKVHIKKGDQVEVIAGKDKGKRGKVLSVKRKIGKAIVEKINYMYKHERAQQDRRGGIVEIEAPIQTSNLMVVSPGDNKPTRVGYVFLEDGRKVRKCRRTGEIID